MSKFMGSPIRMYGTLFGNQSRNTREGGDFLLSNRQCSCELIWVHVEASCESGYSSIIDIPFGLCEKEDGSLQRHVRYILQVFNV